MHPLWLAIRLPCLAQEVLSPSATEATPRSPRAEGEALKAVSAAAHQFSGTLTAQPRAPEAGVHTIWLEIGSSLRLCNGLDPLLAKLRASLARLGYRHTLGVAQTPEGASIVAAAGLPPCRTRDELFAALKHAPAAHLAVPEDVRAALEGSGLVRIGQVLALPLDAMAM